MSESRRRLLIKVVAAFLAIVMAGSVIASIIVAIINAGRT